MPQDSSERLPARDLVWTIHSIEVTGPTSAGGVETFVADYFEFADTPQGLMGLAGRKAEDGGLFHLRVPILESREHPFLPLGLRLAKAMAKNRHLLGRVVVLHRVELVLPLKLVRPSAKVVLFVHTNLSKQVAFSSGRRWALEGFGFRIYEALALRAPRRILVYSKEDFPRILRKNRQSVLGAASVNDRIFAGPTGKENRSGVLWAGRLERVKNPLLAVRAFLATMDQHSQNLLLVGDGLLAEKVFDLVERFALEDRVKVRSSMNRSELAEEMLSREVLLVTSHFEGAPRIIVEAIQQGMKVVSTEGSDPENLIGRKRPTWVVKAKAENLGQAIVEALECSDPLPLGKIANHQRAEVAMKEAQEEIFSVVRD